MKKLWLKAKELWLKFWRWLVPLSVAAGIGAAIVGTPLPEPNLLGELRIRSIEAIEALNPNTDLAFCVLLDKSNFGVKHWMTLDVPQNPIPTATSTASTRGEYFREQFLAYESETKVYRNRCPEISSPVAFNFPKLPINTAEASLFFDGTDDYVNLGNNFDFENTDKLTISLWLKTASTSGNFFSKRETASPFDGYVFQLAAQTLDRTGFRLLGNDGEVRVEITNDTQENDGNWRHVAVTYDGSDACGGFTFYVEGVSRGTTCRVAGPAGTGVANAADTNIAAQRNGAGPIRSNIGEVLVFNRVLSSDEINNTRWLRNIKQENLSGIYHLDEGIGTFVFGAGNTEANGTSTGGGVWEDSPPINYRGD